MHTISIWPGLSAIVETVISTPHRPEPAEACCDFDEPEVGSVERLYPRGRQE